MRIVLYIFVLIGTFALNGQIKHPKASPFSEISQEVGLSKIEIQYSRPATRGRVIFGDLVPYGRIWRVGANASTKITFDTDVRIMGKNLPKGTYALYAFPEEDYWTVVFHTNTKHWGDGRKAYNAKEDALRIRVLPEKIKTLQENFLISFDAITHNSATMLWLWEYTKIKIPMTVDTDAQMRKEIMKQLEDEPTAQSYYEAARYFQEQGTDNALALEYLNKALEIGGDTYYFHRVKSLVQASLNRYAEAIASAEKSLELAAKEEKDEFVRMNQKNIKKWKKLLKE